MNGPKLYRYREIHERGDDLALFREIEDNGERVLVEEISICANMAIRPVYTIYKRDLKEVQE